MKIINNVLILTICLGVTISAHLKKEKNIIESVAYSEGTGVSGQFIQNSNLYKPVQIVDSLDKIKINAEPNPVETIDEIPSENVFYDGTVGMKTTHFNLCGQYTTKPQVCVAQGNCGWCSSSNTCIEGNQVGPLSPCIRGSYVFSAPTTDWNPFPNATKVVQQDFYGTTLTKIQVKSE